MENTIEEEFLKSSFGISDEVSELVKKAEENISDMFKQVEKTAEYNTWRVMKAFSDNKVSENHFAQTTGYGLDDIGRDNLDKVFAQVFGAEDALVRHNLISGTHAISTALFGILRPGDVLLAVTGKPYDTLEEVIGISGPDGEGSLKDYGIKYKQIELLENGMWNEDAIRLALTSEKIKAVHIQRSKGYGIRPTYSAEEIGRLVSFVKSISPDTICFVDNCYGEFADISEPCAFGADLMAGSLIKNAGGGLAPTGGYIAGKSKYVNLCANRLTTVGVGREAGATLGLNRTFYQGFFMAPHTVGQAIKSALLCSSVFEMLGYDVNPRPHEERHDIIQSVILGSADKLCSFCRGIQKGAPVDSFVVPQPCATPGYSEEVIMAAGAFVQGASIELSADGPMREPYVAYMQGGLTYESAKLGIMIAVQEIINEK